MNEINTHGGEGPRVLVTDNQRRDGARTADESEAPTATDGQQTGKALPARTTAPGTQSRRSSDVLQENRTARLEQALDTLNEYVASTQRDLRFLVGLEHGRPVVQVIDRTSQEVVRQIPSELALHLARNLKVIQGEIQGDLFAGYDGNAGSGSHGAEIYLVDTRI